jgi:hypothetical protein
MNKLLSAAMTAITLASGTLGALTPAAAHDWDGDHGGYGYHEHGRDYDGDSGAGAAIAGGIIGLALGSALVSHSYDESRYAYGEPYGYSQPYYGAGYGGGYYQRGYSVCVSRETVWDPYLGRYLVRKHRYAC